MKFAKIFLGYKIRVVLLALMAIEVTMASLVERPDCPDPVNRNTSCVLECATNLETPVRWYFEQNGRPSMEIYRKGKLSFMTRYAINVDGHGHYDIIIKAVDSDNVGKYTCVDDDGKGTDKAEVTVQIAKSVGISPNPPVVHALSTNDNFNLHDTMPNESLMIYSRDRKIIVALPLAIAFLCCFTCLLMAVMVLCGCLIRSRKKVSDAKQTNIYQHIDVTKSNSKIESSLIYTALDTEYEKVIVVPDPRVYTALPVSEHAEYEKVIVVPDHPYSELKL